ncbi:hypothetical protein FGADI_6826 [Fusarium gaditjirri]|uniref:Uncharacterized protein n=1 Tax=Fusarium gaditjirri TaxID=282569 RepID=A0A8H4WWF9_9HYPO|nr:hypothetical protein FGADI_6826 [Fusarium gaditjirri]
MAWFAPIFQAIGFTPNGPLLGSFASWIQGLIGNVAPKILFAIFQSAAMDGYGAGILGNVSKESKTTAMLPSAKSILLAVSVAEHTGTNRQYADRSIMAMGLGAGMVIAPGLVVTPAISAAGFTAEGVVAGSLAAGIQSVSDDTASNSAFAICQSYATGGFGTAVIHGFVQGTGVGVGLGSIFSKWKHNVKYCKSESLDNTDGSKADGTDKEDNTGLRRVVMVAGAAMIVAPVIVAGPALAIAGFGASGIVAGSAAAGIQSGIGSVVAGSAFAILQSAGAGGAGLAVVNGVVQAAGVVLSGSGIAAKLKSQSDGDDDAGDQGEKDGSDEENNAEEMVFKKKD